MIRTARIAAAAAALGAAATAFAQEAPPPAAATGAAPEVVSCLVTRSITQTQAGIDGKWYARTSGGKWWRNTMECPTLQPRRALVHSSPIGSQCKGDIVQVIDFMVGGLNFGGCALGDWERVEKPAPTRQPKQKG